MTDGNFATEYGISGRIGRPRPGHLNRGRSIEGSASSVPDRYRIDTRYDEAADEVLVVADLPDVTVADLTVGLDHQRNELVVAVADRGVERLELPWPVADVESRFNHGVLELRVRPGEAEG